MYFYKNITMVGLFTTWILLMLNAIIASLAEAPGWMLLTAGFAIAYRAFRFPDLTVEASFIAGAVAAACGASVFGSALAGIAVAIAAGGLAGMFTTCVYAMSPRPSFKLLSGVFVGFAMYSVNYLLLSGKVEVGFYDAPTAVNSLADWEIANNLIGRPVTTSIGLVLALILGVLVAKWLKTVTGCALRCAVQRPMLAGRRRSMLYLALGLAISNGLCALGGFWVGSVNAFASIGAGGYLIHALAGSILGEITAERLGFDRRVSTRALVLFPMLGAILYGCVRSIITWGFVELSSNLGVAANQQHQNTFVAAIIMLALIFGRWLSQKKRISSNAIEYIEDDI